MKHKLANFTLHLQSGNLKESDPGKWFAPPIRVTALPLAASVPSPRRDIIDREDHDRDHDRDRDEARGSFHTCRSAQRVGADNYCFEISADCGAAHRISS